MSDRSWHGGIPPTVSPHPVDRSIPGSATVGLALGVASLFTCAPAGIAAIVLGLSARRRIRASEGAEGGDGMAFAAVVLGAAGLIIWTAVVIIVVILRS